MKKEKIKNKRSPKYVRVLASVIVGMIFFTITFSLVVLWGTESIFELINTVQSVETRPLEIGIDENDGYYYIKNDNDEEPIKILQLTDIHLTCSIMTLWQDKLAVEAVIQIVNNTKPDLIILTGDLIYPSVYCLNNDLQSKALGTLFESFEIPWALVYGNHDAENFATLSKTQLSNYFSSLEFCMFQRGPENITGQGNYIIKLLDEAGELTNALVLMDSNAALGIARYDKIHDDQVEWYKTEIAKMRNSLNEIVPSYLFIHIPLNEYDDAWKLYESGSTEVTYFFGIKEWWRVAAPHERGKMFKAILEMGSTKAVFCGHDHLNTFSISYKAIRLTYGMSIDYVADIGIFGKTKQRGGTLLEIENENFEIKQVPQENGFRP